MTTASTLLARANTTSVCDYKTTEEAVEGFLKSERTYVESGLRLGYETFLKRLEIHNKVNQSIISDADIITIFGNYYTLYTANQQLFNDLMKLRLSGNQYLRDGLGSCMSDFIPYFRLYTDYIVNKRQAITRLARLQKTCKKFRNFVKIGEQCMERRLKKVLEEPAERLPQYLQQMSDIYVSWEKDLKQQQLENKENDDENVYPSSFKSLLNAIINIKKVTDEIAVKCRDKKARKLVGSLQASIFKNNIQLLARHRWVVTNATMNMVVKEKKEKLKAHVFILCNDILVISTPPSKFKAGNMIAVFPLIGMRITCNPKIDESLMISCKYRFAVISQNKNFNSPTDHSSSVISSVIIVCHHEKQMQRWIDIIEDTVDEEEHNMKPCNPVDLEKRLRKQKTTVEGKQETITITDPAKIEEIMAWKEDRKNGKKRKRVRSSNKPTLTTIHIGGSSPSKKAPPSSMGRGKAHAPNASLSSISAGPPPKGRPPTRQSINRGVPPGKKSLPPSMRLKKSSSTGSSSPHGGKKPPSLTMKKNKLNHSISASGGVAPPMKKAPPQPSPKKKRDSRSILMSGITGFNKTHMTHIEAGSQSRAGEESLSSSGAPNMQTLLADTLSNYRQFVMDDDEESDGSDGDWDD